MEKGDREHFHFAGVIVAGFMPDRANHFVTAMTGCLIQHLTSEQVRPTYVLFFIAAEFLKRDLHIVWTET